MIVYVDIKKYLDDELIEVPDNMCEHDIIEKFAESKGKYPSCLRVDSEFKTLFDTVDWKSYDYIIKYSHNILKIV
jgi:hypothetical protein|tara:strand:- start:20548 stop:20772 length:225 start_codon:yes stop_codon:yes gene_type:complete